MQTQMHTRASGQLSPCGRSLVDAHQRDSIILTWDERKPADTSTLGFTSTPSPSPTLRHEPRPKDACHSQAGGREEGPSSTEKR
jgi:hypothetical protein